MSETTEVSSGESTLPARRPILLKICGFGPAIFLAAIFLGLAAAWLQTEWLGWTAAGAGVLSLMGIGVLIVYGILFEIRWRLIELLLTVLMGCIPAGWYTHLERGAGMDEKWVAVAVIMFAGQMSALACTLVGISIANMLAEERALRRLMMIAVSSGALGGGLCFCAAIFVTAAMVVGSSWRELTEFYTHLWVAGSLGAICWAVLFHFERKARRLRETTLATEAGQAARLDLPIRAG